METAPQAQNTLETNPDIEILKSLRIGDEQKANLILVRLGKKPAVEIDVYKWNADPEEVRDGIIRAGLCAIEDTLTTGDEKISGHFYVALSEKLAKKLSETSSAKDHAEYGRLMGYPESAIQAFNQNEQISPGHIEKDLGYSSLIFMFSKEHSDAELAIVKDWHNTIWQVAPELAEELHLVKSI